MQVPGQLCRRLQHYDNRTFLVRLSHCIVPVGCCDAILRRYGMKLLDYNLATHGPLRDMMAPSVKFKTSASTATTNGAPASFCGSDVVGVP
jgi:hypothetical protein